MLATFDSIDNAFADAVRQAARGSSLAQDAAHHYLSALSTANRGRFAAIDTLQQTAIKTALDLQNATDNLSRSLVDATSSLNRALFQVAATAIWPWTPLGPFTESVITLPVPFQIGMEEDTASSEDEIWSAYRFQGPMGIIASGLGEIE